MMQASGSSALTWKIGALTTRPTSVQYGEEREYLKSYYDLKLEGAKYLTVPWISGESNLVVCNNVNGALEKMNSLSRNVNIR